MCASQPGTESSGPSSMTMAPAAPAPTCTAVLPSMCGWYQNVPAAWCGIMSYSYCREAPGGMSTSTLSEHVSGSAGLFPHFGETWKPWVCRFVVLMQPK